MNMTSAISLSYAAGITEMPEAVLQDARAGPGETSFADCLQGEMDKSAFSRGESEGDVPAFAVGAKARESEAVIEEKADEIIFSFISPDVFSPKGEAPIVPKRRTLSESGTEGTALSAATEGGQRPETAVNVSGKTEVYVEGKRADADGKTARFAVNAPAFADGFSEKTARAASVRDYANDASGGDYANAAPDGNYANAAPDGNYANVAPDGNYANVAPDGNYVSAAFGADYADGHTRAVVPEGSVASEAFAAAQTDDGGAAESFSRYAAAVLTAEKTPMSIKASETPTGERQASGETAKPLSPGEKPPEAGLFVKQSGVKPDWQAEIKEIRFQAPGQTATRLKEMTEGFLRPVIRENSEIRELLANVKSEQPQVPAPKTDAVEARLKYDAAQTLEARFLAGGADATQGADKGVSDGFRAAAQTFEAIMDRISAFKGRAGATSFELTLNPEKLGRLVIKLVLKDNAVTVRIIADNARTRELLAGRAGIVRESLEQSGVTVERYEVTQSTKAVYREFSDDGGGKNRQGYDEDGQDDGNDEEGELSFAEIVGAMI